MDRKIPEETIIRLSYYLRALTYFYAERQEVVSSRQLADFLKISPHQLRKDLSYFGHFGKKGVGYWSAKLIENIKEILGLDKRWHAAVVGFGNLGKALSFYNGFKEQGIFIKAAFDLKKGIKTDHGNLKVYTLDKMEKVIQKENIRIALLTIPKDAAQNIAARLCNCGIKAILNFAPVKLSLPQDTILKNVDLSCQLSYLTYRLKLQEKKDFSV